MTVAAPLRPEKEALRQYRQYQASHHFRDRRHYRSLLSLRLIFSQPATRPSLPSAPFLTEQVVPLKDRNGEPERGGSEWEPIEILSQKNSAYIPITTLSHTQTSGSTHKPPLIP
jgi:hypothetical protein